MNTDESSGSRMLVASESPGQLGRTQSAGPAPGVSSSIGLQWGPRICISKSSAPTAEPHFEDHGVTGDHPCSSKEKKYIYDLW